MMADGDLDVLAGDLAEETALPRELIRRFGEMWISRQRPFFSSVGENGKMPPSGIKEVARSLKVSSTLLCDSIARVLLGGEAELSFPAFVRGYAKMHARTLKEALPFAFAVFDLDGDGVLSQEEFHAVLNANLALQELDAAAINRVLGSDQGKDTAGVTYDAFRYFASLSSETILACCGFCLHVRAFYVPLTPLGTEAEEAAEEAAKREQQRREREREHAPTQSVAGEGGDEAVDSDNPFSDVEFLAALESLKTTPEERAERCRDRGNEALKQGKDGILDAVDAYTEGLGESCRDMALRATLLANRGAASLMLKNWGKALADSSAALASEALAATAVPKVCRRGAAAAVQLGKLDEAEQLVRTGEQALTDSGQPADAGRGEARELAKLRETIDGKRAAVARRKLEADAREHMQRQTTEAIARRGYKVGGFEDERLREQCVGAASGARIWYDEEVRGTCASSARIDECSHACATGGSQTRCSIAQLKAVGCAVPRNRAALTLTPGRARRQMSCTGRFWCCTQSPRSPTSCRTTLRASRCSRYLMRCSASRGSAALRGTRSVSTHRRGWPCMSRSGQARQRRA